MLLIIEIISCLVETMVITIRPVERIDVYCHVRGFGKCVTHFLYSRAKPYCTSIAPVKGLGLYFCQTIRECYVGIFTVIKCLTSYYLHALMNDDRPQTCAFIECPITYTRYTSRNYD